MQVWNQRMNSSAMIRRSTLLVMTFVLGGCSWFSWLPWIDDDAKEDETKPAKLEPFNAEVRVSVEWQRKVGDGLGKKYIRLVPGVVADRVIAADGYGALAAFDRFSGKPLWQQQFAAVERPGFGIKRLLDRRDPAFVSGGVGVGEGLVLIGTTQGEVIALDVADGSERWRTRVGTEVGAAPTAGDGRVYVQTIDDRISALDVDTGDVAWTYDSQMPLLTLRGTSAPVFDQGVLYSGFANGKVVALRAENGEPIWEQRVMLPEGRSELDRIVDVDARVELDGTSMYALAYQGRVAAISRREGRPMWEQELSGFLDMAQGYGQVYVIDEDDTVSALDKDSGEINWQQSAFARRKLTAPLAFSNYLVTGDEEGYLHVLAQRDGRLVGRRKLGGKGLRTQPIIADDMVYTLTNSGTLTALKVALN
ncbi:MAG TPA: outer membrane protein assembly factor BamB [Gammaproteobacteria bacterium]|nr:outer membrane protein assembly factor BamB [Gammaproteobacteria bacterium]HCY04217.1 outer membrane protein assembly factor BamB [Gammaproteobacteria bacterium]